MRRHSYYIFFSLLCLVLVPSSHAAENNRQQAQQELKNLQSVISKVQQELSSNRKQQSQTLKRIKAIDLELAKASSELAATTKTLDTSQSELKQLQQEQSEKTQLSSQQKKLLAQQLRNAYINGQQEYVKLLLSQEDPSKVSRMLQLYGYLNRARSQDIKNLQHTLARLKVLESEINQRLLALQELQSKHAAQEQQQVELKQQQSGLLAQLKSEYSDTSKRLSRLKSDEKELQTLIDTIKQTLSEFSPKQELAGLKDFKKQLRWPVKGKILHRFGSNKFENKLKWNGIVIGANEGQTVHSIHNGRVVFSDWLRGFGLVTIIDHGKGYLSLYGHNQTLLKTVGSWVEAGEPIATVGQSGGEVGNSVYFEIRYNGKPQNPARWIK